MSPTGLAAAGIEALLLQLPLACSPWECAGSETSDSFCHSLTCTQYVHATCITSECFWDSRTRSHFSGKFGKCSLFHQLGTPDSICSHNWKCPALSLSVGWVFIDFLLTTVPITSRIDEGPNYYNFYCCALLKSLILSNIIHKAWNHVSWLFLQYLIFSFQWTAILWTECHHGAYWKRKNHVSITDLSTLLPTSNYGSYLVNWL